ncbi:response regulator [Cohnella sp.]|uniref:response regulator n=1 Tax=Cohnella sp. TaxID=1883426 RepID=UPI003704A6DD
MKVVLVEDEFIILQGLEIVIGQVSVDFEIVGKASNGLEAISVIEETMPDLVITDIRMPGMDGIELLHHIATFHPKIFTIVLSGYQDYEYMRKSLHYKAVDYLLKPLQSGDLVEALKRVREKWQMSCEAAAAISVEPSLTNWAQPLLQEKWLEQMCFGDLSGVDQAFVREMEARALQGYRIGVAYLDYSGREDFKNDRELVELAALHIVRESVATYPDCIAFGIREGGLAMFLSDKQQEGQPINFLAAELHSNLTYYLKIPVFIGVSEHYEGLERMENAFREVKEIAYQRFLTPSGVLVSSSVLMDRGYGRSDRLAYELPSFHELQQAVMSGNTEIAIERIGQICDSLKQEGLHFATFKSRIQMFSIELWRRIHEWNYDANVWKDFIQFLKKMDDYPNWETLRVDLVQIIRSVTDGVAYLHRNHQSAVQEAKIYIDAHYMDDFSLKDVAEKVYLTPTYFSSLFKMKTGKTFVEYMNEVRIDHGKRLLRETPIKTYEIAEQVGFGSIQHFNKTFRISVGVTPSEYRKQFLEQGRA